MSLLVNPLCQLAMSVSVMYVFSLIRPRHPLGCLTYIFTVPQAVSVKHTIEQHQYEQGDNLFFTIPLRFELERVFLSLWVHIKVAFDDTALVKVFSAM